jgi:hypothetical protein
VLSCRPALSDAALGYVSLTGLLAPVINVSHAIGRRRS